jgi:hypothetical protein
MEKKMTINDFLGKVALRAKELADKPMDDLRAGYPELTDTRAELIRHTREMGLTRGGLIEAILVEEFSFEFDREIEE